MRYDVSNHDEWIRNRNKKLTKSKQFINGVVERFNKQYNILVDNIPLSTYVDDALVSDIIQQALDYAIGESKLIRKKKSVENPGKSIIKTNKEKRKMNKDIDDFVDSLFD